MSRARQMEFFAPSQPLVERLGAEFFRTIPELPGVYRFRAADGTILYVGKARSLRDRLGSYRSLTGQSRKTRRLIVRAVSVDWDICADEAEALAHEARLIKSLKPRVNRAGVWTSPPWHLKVAAEADEWVLSRITAESETPGEGLIGPYRNGHRHFFVVFIRTLWLAGSGFPEPHALPRPLLFTETPWTELRAPAGGFSRDAVIGFLLGTDSQLLERIAAEAQGIGSAFAKAFVAADLEHLQHFWDHHPARKSQVSPGKKVDCGVVF